MRKHNDPEDPYHLDLFNFVVLGGELKAERDIVRIAISSPWMLSNALRAIIAGWGWQLNGDVAGKVCRASVDLLQFGINSIPHRNHVLSLAIIPKSTESETVYQITWDDLRGAGSIAVDHEGLRSARFSRAELPVETAMCDNFKGWGNFSETALGIESNVCFPHATGKAFTSIWYCLFSNCVSRTAAIPAANYSHVKYFPNRKALR